jgi:quaternary ammonium compound-resistance protein SugE
MAWILLFVAGLLETIWAFTMKLSQGFTRPVESIVTLLAMLASFGLLSASMKTLPLGTAYTVWTGIGAVGAFVVGVVVLGEAVNAARVLAAVLIVSGLTLMKVSTP